jgi:hypothetical protein
MTDTTGTIGGDACTAGHGEAMTGSCWWPPGVARVRTPASSLGRDDRPAEGVYGVYDRLEPHLAMLHGTGA